MLRFQHILVPVDFEPSSLRALEVGIDLASRFEAKLTIFHAWEIPTYAYTSPFVAGDVWALIAEAAKQQLEKTAADVRERFPRAEPVLVHGPAAEEILAYVEQSKADLVIMGTHGRKGLSRFVLGSVAEKVVRGCAVPVLTVRGPERP